MANRVIKDSIWHSPSLTKLSFLADILWPRFLLLADDWGCFNSDPDVIRGLAFPKRKGIGAVRIEQILQEYNNTGLLFLWETEERRWGYFISWDGHNFCNASTVDEGGKYTKHRRKTPEPPKDLLEKYLKTFITSSDKFRHSSTKSSYPKPNPKPIKKDTGKPALSKITKDLLDKIYKQGFNVYALLGRFKKKSKIDLPEAVIEKVCNSYLKNHEKIQNDWPWFITAVEKASREHFAEQSRKEGQAWKNQPVAQSIKDIMRKAGG